MARQSTARSAKQAWGRYEYSDGRSSDFLEATLVGNSFKVTYGKIGSSGQTSTKQFRTESEAKKEYDRLIAEKVKKGYQAVATPSYAAEKKKKPASSKRAPSTNEQIVQLIEKHSATPDEFVELVGAVIESQPDLKAIRPYVDRLLRAAFAAPVVEGVLVGEVAWRAAELDATGNDLIAQKRSAGEAKRSLLEGTELLTATEVSRLLGSRSENARQYANNLRKKGELLWVPRANQYLYPAFQFDPERKRVFPEVPIVCRILNVAADPWGVLSWWTSPNARISDRKPRELLGTKEAEHLSSLAEAVVEPVG